MSGFRHGNLVPVAIKSDPREVPIFRLTVEPRITNGLRQTSQIQIDKIMIVLREKLGPSFGRLDDTTLVKVNRALAVFAGIA